MRLRQRFLCLVLIIHITFTVIHFLWKWWRIIYKYLGMWISKERNFKKAIQHISSQSKKVIFALKQCLIKLQAPPVNVALHLFNSIINQYYAMDVKFGASL